MEAPGKAERRHPGWIGKGMFVAGELRLVSRGDPRERGETMSLLLKGVIREGRVEVGELIDLPDGTEVVVSAGAAGPDVDATTPEEIARVLAAMRRLLPLEIPEAVGADLDAWERKLDRHGVDHADSGIEDVFR